MVRSFDLQGGSILLLSRSIPCLLLRCSQASSSFLCRDGRTWKNVEEI